MHKYNSNDGIEYESEDDGGSKLNCVIVLFFLLASKISFHIEFIEDIYPKVKLWFI